MLGVGFMTKIIDTFRKKEWVLLLGFLFLLGCKSEYKESPPQTQPTAPGPAIGTAGLREVSKVILNRLVIFQDSLKMINNFMSTHRALHSVDENGSLFSGLDFMSNIDFRELWRTARIVQKSNQTNLIEMNLNMSSMGLPPNWINHCNGLDAKLVVHLEANAAQIQVKGCDSSDYLDLIQLAKIDKEELEFLILADSFRRLFPESQSLSGFFKNDDSKCQMKMVYSSERLIQCENLSYASSSIQSSSNATFSASALNPSNASGIFAIIKSIKIIGTTIEELESESEIVNSNTKAKIKMKIEGGRNILVSQSSENFEEQKLFSLDHLSEKWFYFTPDRKIPFPLNSTFPSNDLIQIRDYIRGFVFVSRRNKEVGI